MPCWGIIDATCINCVRLVSVKKCLNIKGEVLYAPSMYLQIKQPKVWNAKTSNRSLQKAQGYNKWRIRELGSLYVFKKKHWTNIQIQSASFFYKPLLLYLFPTKYAYESLLPTETNYYKSCVWMKTSSLKSWKYFCTFPHLYSAKIYFICVLYSK